MMQKNDIKNERYIKLLYVSFTLSGCNSGERKDILTTSLYILALIFSS